MPLSVVDLYKNILPKTNCGDCGFPTCIAFASMVVSEKFPIDKCPHLTHDVVKKCSEELQKQYDEGKWLKRDMAKDALEWAKERSASLDIAELPQRIGGEVVELQNEISLKMPYFNTYIYISGEGISQENGSDLSVWEKVFIYNHLAMGGKKEPTGNWKGFIEFPNTVSKVISMVNHVELPLIDRFHGKTDELKLAARSAGASDVSDKYDSADAAFRFEPFPKVPVTLLFWDDSGDENDMGSIAKLLFDETITEHLDIESIVFMSERICQMLCDWE